VKWIWWCAAAGFAGWIWWMSSHPVTVSTLPEHSDKVIHAVTWAVLAALIAAGGRAARWPARATLLIAAGLAALYGVVDELHQSQVPTRIASVADAIADAVGAIAGALAITYLGRRRDRR
jgi:VanZ family protein